MGHIIGLQQLPRWGLSIAFNPRFEITAMVRHNLQRMADPLALLFQGLLNHCPITGLQHLNGQNRDILMLEAALVS